MPGPAPKATGNGSRSTTLLVVSWFGALQTPACRSNHATAISRCGDTWTGLVAPETSPATLSQAAKSRFELRPMTFGLKSAMASSVTRVRDHAPPLVWRSAPMSAREEYQEHCAQVHGGADCDCPHPEFGAGIEYSEEAPR